MKFSVAIPAYNVAPYIRECIETAERAARHCGIETEIVCVDDGSTDGTAETIDRCAAECAARGGSCTVRAVHKPNGGVSSARNAALDAATGDWILFADGDDVLRETWLSTVAAGIEQNPDADLVSFDILRFRDEANWQEGDPPPSFRDIGIADAIPEELVACTYWRFAYSAKTHGSLRFPPNLGEDLLYVFAAFERSRKCVMADRKEYGYRQRQGSFMHSKETPARMAGAIDYNLAMFRLMSESKKRIDGHFPAGRGDQWIYSLPKAIMPHRRDPEWRSVVDAWFDSMAYAAECPALLPRQRRTAARLAKGRSAFSVWLNCTLAARLAKVLGRRRRKGEKDYR